MQYCLCRAKVKKEAQHLPNKKKTNKEAQPIGYSSNKLSPPNIFNYCKRVLNYEPHFTYSS